MFETTPNTKFLYSESINYIPLQEDASIINLMRTYNKQHEDVFTLFVKSSTFKTKKDDTCCTIY